ncbi:hypothetical protein RRG08_026495 [Elysia crispata]|uniref:G-protein coupled receptors family 2 profile 2 domain-containing protein n=1 Tax=Elysia crispata TaxID=231223 RepID=A0AAE0Y3Y5_9GAST|nr:hypothetical protein RRG08_026495 [Elysia crispata]
MKYSNSAVPDIRLNQDSLSAEVVIKPSDDVRGLIKFAQESSVVIINDGATDVQLTVNREKGQQYDVEVTYETEQMSDSVTISGSIVYPALENQDFRRQSGTLTFSSGSQDPNYITVNLTPDLDSDNPLPKQFYVRLYSPTNDARVDTQAARATVRIVDDANAAIWRVISNLKDGNLTDSRIINTVSQLDKQADDRLTDKSLDLIEDVLKKINAEGEKRSLPTEVVTAVKNLYCSLLESTLDDARKGRVSLASTVEDFSYTLLKDKPCEAQGANSKELHKAECGAIKIASGRWRQDQLSGNQFDLQQGNSIAVPDPLPEYDNDADETNNECIDFSLVEYRKSTWFETGSADAALMNGKVIGFSLKNRQSTTVQNPVTFTIHTQDRRIAAKGAQCKYFDEGLRKWVSPSGICSVKNSLGDDDFVTCECKHMTNYGVSASTQGDNIIGYVVWFYIICFICMTCILLAVLVHHLFNTRPTFSASLHMHFLMAVFFTHMCFVIDAFLSEDEILALNSDDDNSDCITMSLFLHYFFLAQFMWIAIQAVNLWKIFILNDEHTDRHFIVFFIIGWGVPVVLLAIFYAVTFNIYKYHTSLDVQFIYGDVNNNGEICFITNEYAALAGILAPVLVCLFVLALVCMKAYQVASQWQMYDDVYRGRSNEKELPLLLVIYGMLVLLSVWLALHMIYGYLWMLILFCIFDVIFGLLNFVQYAVVRNPIFASIFGPKKASYSVSSEVSAYPDHQISYYTSPSSIKGSEANLLNDTWESNTDGGRSRMTVRRALPSQAYINPPIAVISPAGTISSDSPDFDDLIFALKMGSAGIHSVSPSEISGAMSTITTTIAPFTTIVVAAADTSTTTTITTITTTTISTSTIVTTSASTIISFVPHWLHKAQYAHYAGP